MFRDDIFAIWNHSLQELYKFFEFINSIDTSSKIKFTISIANNDSVLEFLDLSLHTNEHNKICVDVYVKPTNSFTYVLPSTYYPKKNINKVPKRLKRICNSDKKFDILSYEYQNYLISRDNNPTLVKNSFTLLEI